jgi:hypothetical protein
VVDVASVVALEDPDSDALIGVESRDSLTGSDRRRQAQRARDSRQGSEQK